MTAVAVAVAPPTRARDLESPNPVLAWSGRFPVERGGVVAVVGGSPAGAARELQKWQASMGITGVETSRCDVRLAVWIPGIACPEPVAVREALGRAGPLVFHALPATAARRRNRGCLRAQGAVRCHLRRPRALTGLRGAEPPAHVEELLAVEANAGILRNPS